MKKVQRDPAPTGPTVEDVESLFNELIPDRYNRKDGVENDPGVLALEGMIEDQTNRVMQDKRLLELGKKLAERRRKVHADNCLIAAEAEAVRRVYRSEGLTGHVQGLLANLVKLANGKKRVTGI